MYIVRVYFGGKLLSKAQHGYCFRTLASKQERDENACDRLGNCAVLSTLPTNTAKPPDAGQSRAKRQGNGHSALPPPGL